jgi:dihydroneopterin aldolase
VALPRLRHSNRVADHSHVRGAGATDDVRLTLDYSHVTKLVTDFAEASQYKSVEGLAEGIAQVGAPHPPEPMDRLAGRHRACADRR